MAKIDLGKVKGDNGMPAGYYAECSTPSSTIEKSATIFVDYDVAFELKKGITVTVYFTNENTATNITLNVNETGAKEIYYQGSNLSSSLLVANGLYDFVYDGTYWQLKGMITNEDKTKLDSIEEGATRVIVDDVLSSTSTNTVQNKVVKEALDNKADNVLYDGETGEFQLRSGTKVLSTTTIKSGGGGGIQLAQPTSLSLTNADESVVIKWTDPSDLTLDGVTLAKWAGTLVVRKVGSAPTSKTDGVVVVDSKTKDEYKSTGFTDNNLTNGTKYYYGIFPYTTDNVYTYDYTNSITPTAIYPTAPSGVSVSSGNAEITVTFTKPDDATGIRIVYGTKSPTSQTDGTIINTTTSPYTITGLTNDTTYYVIVYSYNAKGRFTASNAVSATPKALELVAWSTGTDAQIKAMIDAYYNGDATLDQIKSVWSVGDTRNVTLSAMSAKGVGESHSSQTVQLAIIGFNHDDLATSVNGKTKALITVQLKNCLNTEGYMNSSNTNSGGWEGSARRTWCNNVFKNAIPSTIKGLIKNVNKKNYKVYNSTTLSTTSDSCFLLSETEIFGSKTYSAGATEGTQYEYYKTSSNRIKQVNGSNYYWWERSPRSSSSATFCVVYSNGSASYFNAGDARGLAPGFCL